MEHASLIDHPLQDKYASSSLHMLGLYHKLFWYIPVLPEMNHTRSANLHFKNQAFNFENEFRGDSASFAKLVRFEALQKVKIGEGQGSSCT